MILVVDLNFKKNSLGLFEFVSPIVAIAEEFDECFVKHYLDVKQEDLDKCSSIVLSGTALRNNVTLTQSDRFEWVKNCNRPVLGICAGMQTIGVVFGGPLELCLEIGMTQITTLKDNPLFSSTFKAYSLHNYSLHLSPEFDALAESENCVQAMKHKQKDIYGVLFHPEVRNQEILQRFIRAFHSTEDLKTHTS